jgi:signal-transduction protein with cAMP-binding, CBS, and nucleotidyltransferase domain
LIRNKLKNILKKEPFFQKLSKGYTSKLLDSFTVANVEKGKTVIDTYKKQKCALIYILEGNVDIAFPKFINAKSQRIITAIKEQNK